MSTPFRGTVVTQPPAAPWRYGLYSAATLLTPEDQHWQIAGVVFSPDTCASGGLWPGGICTQRYTESTWTMATSDATGAPITITQPAPGDRPFVVLAQLPDKDTERTLAYITVVWDDGGTSTQYLGDRPNPQPAVTHDYEGAAGAHVITVTYAYTDAVTTTSTITVTFTGDGPTERTKKVGGVDWDGATPFVVQDGVECLSIGFPEASTRAQIRLGWNEPRLAELAFWRGYDGADPYLAGPRSYPVTDMSKPAPDIVTALGRLEYAGQKAIGTELTIHAPRFLASVAADRHLVVPDGAVLRTPLGNRWAFGAGYDLTGPDGTTTPETAWLYATGPVVVRRGPVITNEVFASATNRRSAVAERQIAITAECGQLAAKVAVPGLDVAVLPPIPIPDPGV